jgi:uncharacterized protein (TIGR01244 family)
MGTFALALFVVSGCKTDKPADKAAAAPTTTTPKVESTATQPPMHAPALEPYSCGTVERLHTWNGIFAGSQPAADDLKHASENGIKTILDLRPASENRGFDEREVVTGLGMEYDNVPFASPADLTDATFDKARAILRDESKKPVFVHCHSGNRVGAIWYAFRVLDGGLSSDAALEEAHQVGLKTPALEKRAMEYVEHERAKGAGR